MPRENGFKNQRVVIVGGSSGIGLAVAEEAASQGADVVIVSSKAERVQEALKSIGGEARGEAVDVSDEKAVESFFTNLGAFDHLVFTAGDSLQLHALADTDLKQARRAFELRYWSALATVKYGSPQIRKGGSIVLTTGIAGRRPLTLHAVNERDCRVGCNQGAAGRLDDLGNCELALIDRNRRRHREYIVPNYWRRSYRRRLDMRAVENQPAAYEGPRWQTAKRRSSA